MKGDGQHPTYINYRMKLQGGTLHDLTDEITESIIDAGLTDIWNDLTPLARNEWICWMTHAKKQETREKRRLRCLEDLRSGKRRPCCWPGCPHHRESAQKWFR